MATTHRDKYIICGHPMNNSRVTMAQHSANVPRILIASFMQISSKFKVSPTTAYIDLAYAMAYDGLGLEINDLRKPAQQKRRNNRFNVLNDFNII
eukprot:scaffold417789_cov16-Prasinocladus_malaysianus.AAC.1